MLARGGPDACPPTSIMGHGYAIADADGVEAKATVTLVNGGARRVTPTCAQPPGARARSCCAVADHQAELAGRGPTRRTSTSRATLQIVAGIPLRVADVPRQRRARRLDRDDELPEQPPLEVPRRDPYATGQVVKTDGSVACRS